MVFLIIKVQLQRQTAFLETFATRRSHTALPLFPLRRFAVSGTSMLSGTLLRGFVPPLCAASHVAPFRRIAPLGVPLPTVSCRAAHGAFCASVGGVVRPAGGSVRLWLMSAVWRGRPVDAPSANGAVFMGRGIVCAFYGAGGSLRCCESGFVVWISTDVI